MEDAVELGFEGANKLTDKYHDRVYGHFPARQNSQRKQQKEQNQRNQQAQQYQNNPDVPTNGQHRERRESSRDERSSHKDRDMASYGPSYASDRRQDYRDERDVRYVDESFYYKGANAGTVALSRDRGQTGYDFAPPSQAPVANGYDNRRDYDYDYAYAPRDRERPGMSRQRSNSWSPREDRRGRNNDNSSRRRRRSRSSSNPNLRDKDSSRRIAAAALGALLGGYAANKAAKGKAPYDTFATVGGAVLGGIASREIVDHIGHKKEEKREKRQTEEEAWEAKYGKDEHGDREDRSGRNDRGGDDRRRIRDS